MNSGPDDDIETAFGEGVSDSSGVSDEAAIENSLAVEELMAKPKGEDITTTAKAFVAGAEEHAQKVAQAAAPALKKLNIGAGNKKFDGWLSVDADASTSPDIVGTALSVPLPDGCASAVMAIHLLEHLYEWEAEPALREWFRLLAPGGSLILEMPDFLKFCRNIADGVKGRKHPDQMGMWPAYGDPREKNPLMCHKWAYWFESLRPMVESVGFRDVKEAQTEFHKIGREHRDFRLEARKP